MERFTFTHELITSCAIVLVVQISPFILNTVMTITAAMMARKQDEQSQENRSNVSDLWSIMNIYESNFWFLGVDQATEVTENFREQDRANEGESFAAEVKVQHFILTVSQWHYHKLCCPSMDKN